MGDEELQAMIDDTADLLIARVAARTPPGEAFEDWREWLRAALKTGDDYAGRRAQETLALLLRSNPHAD